MNLKEGLFGFLNRQIIFSKSKFLHFIPFKDIRYFNWDRLFWTSPKAFFQSKICHILSLLISLDILTGKCVRLYHDIFGKFTFITFFFSHFCHIQELSRDKKIMSSARQFKHFSKSQIERLGSRIWSLLYPIHMKSWSKITLGKLICLASRKSSGNYWPKFTW